MKRNRLRVFIGSGGRTDYLFVLLVLTSLPLFALVVLGVTQLIRHIRSGGSMLFTSGADGLNIYAQVWAILSMLLFIAVGWGIWWLYRRRHLDQLRLRRSEMKYRNIINHAGEAIFMLDTDGTVLEWNKAAEGLFGAPRRNVLGHPFRDIHLCYGVEIDKAMNDARRLNRSVTLEVPLRARGRQDFGELSLVVSRNRDSGGPRRRRESPDTYVIIARDITREKQLESRMSETEKMAGIGQFAAGIAHQLNTPLGSILLSAQMLEEAIENDDDVEDVQRIIRQTEQCRTIIKGLLNFARPSGRSRSRIKLAEVIRETIYLMDKTLRTQNVTVMLDFLDPGEIFGNRNELEQVFFNLLANALDALDGGGDVRITMRTRDTREVEVLFADSGEGISEELRGQIFLPFFTTKDYGKGTGLGLPIVARIVHEHGGHIELLEHRGARFLMTFPVYRPGLDEERPDALVEDGSGGPDSGDGI